MAKRELSNTLKNLKFMQRAVQREEKSKKEEEVIPDGNFPSSGTLNKWMSGRGQAHGGRSGRRGRARRGVHEVPVHEVSVQEEGFGQVNASGQAGQANVVEQVGQAEIPGQAGQAAMGALAREMAGALRESMNILRAENQARENAIETSASFLTREFLRAKPDEFHGGPEPKKADEWLEQTVKTFEMFHIEDSELRVTLASYYLKGDAGQWWKYAKGRVEPTWEAFVVAFQDKYLPPTARERLRQEFQDLKQLNMSVAEFEAAFSSLSRFAPELVATEELRCIEFEKKLRTEILFNVAGNMIRNYNRLVEAAAHVEIIVEAEDEKLQGSRLRGQGSQGDYRPNKKSRNTFSSQSQPQQSRSTFPLPNAGSGKSASGNFSCFKCGQPGHKAFACPQKGGGQHMLPPPPYRSQSQFQSRGQGFTCFQCGQPGHMKRVCPQLGGASGASGSRQTQSHQQAHSVQTSRTNQGAASAQSVQQAYAPRDEQVDQRPQGRVYVVTAPELLPGSSVVRAK